MFWSSRDTATQNCCLSIIHGQVDRRGNDLPTHKSTFGTIFYFFAQIGLTCFAICTRLFGRKKQTPTGIYQPAKNHSNYIHFEDIQQPIFLRKRSDSPNLSCATLFSHLYLDYNNYEWKC